MCIDRYMFMLHLQKALHPSVFVMRPAWGDELAIPPDYVWREGRPPRIELLGKAKQQCLSVEDRNLLHIFFLVECKVYASAFSKFALGSFLQPPLTVLHQLFIIS